MMRMAVLMCALALLFSLQASAQANSSPTDTVRYRPVKVTISAKQVEGRISPDLIGFNVVYANEKDKYWADDLLPAALRPITSGFLRFPAGTAVSSWQWDKPTGRFKVDGWSRQFDGVYAPETQWMSLDEYMANVQKIGAKPLVGINISSGYINNRDEDSLASAVALAKYNLEKGYNVKHYYIDNEQYLTDGEPQRMSAERYAQYVNLYADALRNVDPEIKIIANWVYNKGRMAEWNTFFTIAGHNIDYLDVHEYWAHSNASFERWAGARPMTRWDGLTYDALIRIIRDDIARRGLKTKIGFFEWNIGAGAAAHKFPSPYQAGLIIAEQFMQMIRGGLDVATFWPLHWKYDGHSARWQPRTLFDNTALESGRISARPIYDVFRLYHSVMGQQLVRSSANDPGAYVVAAADESGRSVTVYILNKVDTGATVDLQLSDWDLSPEQVAVQAESLTAPNGNLLAATAQVTELPWQIDAASGGVALSVAPYSFTKVTVRATR